MARPRLQRKRPKLSTKPPKLGAKPPKLSSQPPKRGSKPSKLGAGALARGDQSLVAVEAIQLSRRWGADVEDATEKILAVGREAMRRDMEARVQIGEQLVRVQKLLEHGLWMEWVEVELPFALRTAELLVQQFSWARDHPRRFALLAPLGVSKLRMLQRQSDKKLKSLLSKRVHTVPDTRRHARVGATQRRTLQQMSVSQMKALLVQPEPEPLPPPLSPRATVKRCRQQTQQLAGTVDDLLQLGDEVSRRTLGKLYKELSEVLGTLEQALDG